MKDPFSELLRFLICCRRRRLLAGGGWMGRSFALRARARQASNFDAGNLDGINRTVAFIARSSRDLLYEFHAFRCALSKKIVAVPLWHPTATTQTASLIKAGIERRRDHFGNEKL